MDEKLRKLERMAATGDCEAAERLRHLESRLASHPQGMRQAELLASSVSDFHHDRAISCYCRGGSTGEYVSVWAHLPSEYHDGVFLGVGLIDGIECGTNVIVAPLQVTDSLYPYFPGTNPPEPKLCGECGIRPITRITDPYTHMVCHSCYPAAQQRDDESLAAEIEMMDNFHNPDYD